MVLSEQARRRFEAATGIRIRSPAERRLQAAIQQRAFFGAAGFEPRKAGLPETEVEAQRREAAARRAAAEVAERKRVEVERKRVSAAKGEASARFSESETLVARRDAEFAKIASVDRRIDSLSSQVNQARLVGLIVKARQLNRQRNDLITQRNAIAGRVETLQSQAFEKFEQGQAITERERVEVAGVAPTEAAVERVEAAEPVPLEFTPEAGRGLVRERVEEAFGVPELRRAAEVAEERGIVTPEARLGFIREAIPGVAKLPAAPVTGFFETFTGLAGFGVAKVGKPLIAEPIVEKEKAIEPLRIEFLKAVGAERFVTPKPTKEEITRGLFTTGEVAAAFAAFALPEAVKKGVAILPKLRLPRKPPKAVFAPELAEPAVFKARAELAKRGLEVPAEKQVEFAKGVLARKPVVTKPTVGEVGRVIRERRVPELKEFLLVKRKPTPAVAPEIEKAIKLKFFPELGKQLRPTTPAQREAFKRLIPSLPTRAARPITKQLVKVKPKKIPFKEAFPGFPGEFPGEFPGVAPEVITKPVSILQAAPFVPKAVKAVKLPKVTFGIPEAALTLGLRAGVKRERALKPIEAEVEFAEVRIVAPARAERILPVSLAVPKARPAVRLRPEIKVTQQLKEISKQLPKLVPRAAVAVTPVTTAKQIARIVEVPAIAEKAVERITPRFAERVVTRPRFRIPREIVRPRPPEELLKRKPLRRVPLPLLLPEEAVRRRVVLPRIAPGFGVLVRRRGVFRPVLPGIAVSKETAQRLVQQIVGGTPAAAARIVRVPGKPVKIKGLPEFRPEQFRRPIRKGVEIPSGILIEKTRFRIDQPGELAGITALGLKAPRKKKRRKKAKKKKKKRGK